MNNYYFNKDNFSFYPEILKEDYEKSPNGWPCGMKKVTEKDYLFFNKGKSGYKLIEKDGFPFFEKLIKSDENLKEEIFNEIKSKNELIMSYITPLDFALKLGIATKEEEDKLKIFQKYIVILNRIPSQKGFPNNIVWPDFPTT